MIISDAAGIMLNKTKLTTSDIPDKILALPSVQGFSVGRNYHCLVKCSKDIQSCQDWNIRIGGTNYSSGGLTYMYRYYTLYFEFYKNSIQKPLWISPYYLSNLFEYDSYYSYDSKVGNYSIGGSPIQKTTVLSYGFSLSKRIADPNNKFNTFYLDFILHRTNSNTYWSYYTDGSVTSSTNTVYDQLSFSMAVPWASSQIFLCVSESEYKSHVVEHIKDIFRNEG